MPLFGNSQANPGTTWEPKAAETRLAHTAGVDPAGIFSSDLSVSEYVLLGEAGFEPLGFVLGSSIYHVGLQVGRWSQNQELQVLSQAMYNARELAMLRMRVEATHLGADGIVGVQLKMQIYAWGQDVLEFVATGTAVKATAGNGAHRAPDGQAFTSDLSAQDFFRLLAAGAVPVAFVLGTCVYHIAHQSSMQALRQTGQNQEMVQFTQGVYDAREFALSRMQAEAAAKAPGSSASASTSQTTSGASTPPNSSLPAPPSGVLARSTGCPRLLQSLPSPLASVPERAGVGRFWPPNDAQRRHLLRNTKQHLGRSTARAATAIFSSILRGATLPTEGRREA